MESVERLPRNRGRWIAVALLVVAAILAVLIVLRWRGRPAAVVSPAPVDAGATPALDRGAGPDAGAPQPAEAPPKKARPATRRLADRELREVQRRGMPLLRSCVERQRLGTQGTTKKVTVLVQLAEGGEVSSVAVDTGGDVALAECLRRMVRSWRFPSDLRAQKVVFPVILGGAE